MSWQVSRIVGFIEMKDWSLITKYRLLLKERISLLIRIFNLHEIFKKSGSENIR